MSQKQPPLPGFENLVYNENPASVFLLYAAHCELRNEISKIATFEMAVLREMGVDNGEIYPSDVYAAQRGILITLRELIHDIDAMNLKIESMFHAK